MADASLSPATRRWLLALARRTVEAALADGGRHLPDPDAVPPEAAEPGAAFVTLRREGRLLGCIGSMRAVRPLADDVATHAYDAAFRDPRLPAVTADDCEHMDVEISVLGPLEPVVVADRAELVRALRPGVDGLLVTSGGRQGTFLPSVWEQVASPEEFLDLLWRKAGLARRSWPEDLVVQRYEVTELSEDGPPGHR